MLTGMHALFKYDFEVRLNGKSMIEVLNLSRSIIDSRWFLLVSDNFERPHTLRQSTYTSLRLRNVCRVSTSLSPSG